MQVKSVFSVDAVDKNISIKKNDSEISLGLNRSLSLQEELCKLGDLCRIGQYFWLGFRISLFIGVGGYMITDYLIKDI
jgi:hypothetical protein